MNEENFNKELGQKIKTMREKFNMTLNNLSKKIGFSNYQTLASIESGERQVKANELVKLCKIFQIDLEKLIQNPIENSVPVVLWRNKYQINEEVSYKENMFLTFCDRYYDLEQKCGIERNELINELKVVSHKKILSDSYNYIDLWTAELTNILQLGSRPALSLGKVLEEKFGIKLLYLDLRNCGSGASTVNDEFGSVILINRFDMPWRRNYDIAHELFHILTWDLFAADEIHCTDSSNGKTQVEKWADAFASRLLLPSNILENEIKRHIKDNQIFFLDFIDIAREFGVSTEALLWRLVLLGKLKEADVKKIFEEGELLQIDKNRRDKEREGQAPYISDRYIFLAFKCFQMGLLAWGILAEYLDCERNELSDFLKKYGYSDKEDYDFTINVGC